MNRYQITVFDTLKNEQIVNCQADCVLAVTKSAAENVRTVKLLHKASLGMVADCFYSLTDMRNEISAAIDNSVLAATSCK